MTSASNKRRRDLARIHCLAKELGLDDCEYRDVLWTVARVRSARDLDAHGRGSVIRQLQSRVQKRPAGKKSPRVSDDRKPLASKVSAQRDALGVSDAYIDAIAQRVCGVDRWIWCDSEQLHKVVAALTYAQRRQEGCS